MEQRKEREFNRKWTPSYFEKVLAAVADSLKRLIQWQ